MAQRCCDGSDPNLTRVIRMEALADDETISPWNSTARVGTVIINCHCGLHFDDVERSTIYPHNYIGQRELFDPFDPT